MGNKLKRLITIHAIGTPDIELAEELFAPLFLKIHERNKSKCSALHPLPAQQEHGADTFTAWGSIPMKGAAKKCDRGT